MALKYQDACILAPMVRIGTLPMRLLALKYGADIVYSEEIIDFKMLRATRIQNDMLGTTDFVAEDGTVVFRTCSLERSRVVFQIGTADAHRALKVAKMVEYDVAAFDVNMGCPKAFSISGGMGAALLKKPDRIREILSLLVANLSIPVTCKIRVLDGLEETIELARLIQSTGVSALAVHGRSTEERPGHPNRNHFIRGVAQALTIPVIANGGSGDMKQHSDIQRFRMSTGAAAVMIARAAERNVSIFRSEGLLSKEDLIKEYLKVAIDYDNHWSNSKYCIQQVLGSDVQTEQGERLLASSCPTDIYELYGMMDYYTQVNSVHQVYIEQQKRLHEQDMETFGGLKMSVVKSPEGRIIHYICSYSYDSPFRKSANGNQTPKMILVQHFRRRNLPEPTFHYEERSSDRNFRCKMHHEGIFYESTAWQKRKVWAEHSACELYIRIHNLCDTAHERTGQAVDRACHKRSLQDDQWEKGKVICTDSSQAVNVLPRDTCSFGQQCI